MSANTVKSYKRDLQDFLDFLAENTRSGEILCLQDLQDCNLNTIRNWLNGRICKAVGHRSNARAMSAVKLFFKYANENDYIRNHCAFNVRQPKLPQTLPKAVNNEYIARLLVGLDRVNKAEWQKNRDKAIALLMFTAGLRISEAVGLKSSQIRGSYISIIGKGNKNRIVPLVPSAKDYVERYLSTCPFFNDTRKYSVNSTETEKYIFFINTGQHYYSRLAQRNFEKARQIENLPEYITPHVLRHSCATTLLQNSNHGSALKKIQSLLGHSRVSTTQIYTKIDKSSIVESIKRVGSYNQ
jgi:integrase/recombinase XerC